MPVLYIVLFLVFLSLLIMIHELGHLTVAKLFKVYCFEYAIGFGPKLVSFKRKGGETSYSIRAIPFGGFVSMYGEGVELPEGLEIDSSRSLENIKKWKKILILFAGVFMNAILAFVLFFISAIIPRNVYHIDDFAVESGSVAYNAGLRENANLIYYSFYDNDGQVIENTDASETRFYLVDKDVTLYLNGNELSTKAFVVLDSAKFSSFDKLDITNFMSFYESKVVDEETQINFEKGIEFNQFDRTIIHLNYFDKTGLDLENLNKDDIVKQTTGDIEITVDSENGGLKAIGCAYKKDTASYGFGGSIKRSFYLFGESSTLIVKTLGALFTSTSAWGNVGGIVAIGYQSSNILANYGFAYFLLLWGEISVNLAIVNLLPFPGLDGWQIVVTVIEGISKKKIPEKAKSIVSFIGLALLMLLMVAIIVKDVIGIIG